MTLFLTCVLFFGETYFEDIRDVKVVRVHDGDTIIVDLPGEKRLFGYHRGVRIRGIDTPELHDKRPIVRAKAIQAKNVVESLISKARRIDLVDTGREKYDRICARVLADGVDIGEVLLRRKLAKPYDGGHKDEDHW